MVNKYTKRYLTSLVTGEMKIKATMKYLLHTKMAIIKKMDNDDCW